MPLAPASAALVAEGATPQLVVARAATQVKYVEDQLPMHGFVSDAIDRIPATWSAGPSPSVAKLGLASDKVTLGAYDPERQLPIELVGLEHWYVRQDNPGELAAALKHAQNRHTLMVTIEPYLPSGDRAPVLDRIEQGQMDSQVRLLARTIAHSAPQAVLVRWGHEMELSGLYPWAANDPQLYRAAFRRVVSIFRAEGAANASFVWSPAGNDDADAYYPGDDVVDYVGVTVLGDEQWDEDSGASPQSFTDLFAPRYARMAGYGKPIVVAELGVSGTSERQALWLEQANQSVDQFPLLRALVYFNAKNPWPGAMDVAPDWRVSPELLGGSFALTD
jgi:beta-mannanase